MPILPVQFHIPHSTFHIPPSTFHATSSDGFDTPLSTRPPYSPAIDRRTVLHQLSSGPFPLTAYPSCSATCRAQIIASRLPTATSSSWTLRDFYNSKRASDIALKLHPPRAPVLAAAGAHHRPALPALPALPPRRCLNLAWPLSSAALGARDRSAWTPATPRRPVPYNLGRTCTIATGVLQWLDTEDERPVP